MKEKIKGSIMGSVIGDAMGLPVEFKEREQLESKPITKMMGFGTHKQPIGTWTDDTSMVLCTMDSLLNGLNYESIGENFCDWIKYGKYTPFGKPIGVGRGTLKALNLIDKGTPAIEAGSTDIKFNGNGSLMRILPIAFYIHKNNITEWQEIVENLSKITHGHSISTTSCIIYVQYILNLLDNMDKETAYNKLRTENFSKYTEYINAFDNILKTDIRKLHRHNIKSDGYVISTLEASLWSFLTTNTFKDCILTAVNLGGDTDTIACISGGLAGLYYGLDSIPANWISQLQSLEYLNENINAFADMYS